jgi:TonB family protein
MNVDRIRGQQTRAAAHEEPQEQVIGNDSPGVRVDLHSANLIHRREVNYPDAALKRGVEGAVEIEATLDQTGNVSDARVLSGPDELRKSALQSVLEWHFMRNAGPSRLVSITFDKVAAQAARNETYSTSAISDTSEVRYNGELHAISVGTNQKFSTRQFVLEQFESDPKITEEFQPAERAAYEALKTEEERRQFLMDFWRRRSPADLEKIPPLVAYALEHPSAEEGKALEAQSRQTAGIVQRKLKAAEAEAAPLPGRAVKNIVFTGLSSLVKNDLAARLPIHVGDVLSESVMETAYKAVKAYDEHLEISVLPSVDGQAEVRIGVAGVFEKAIVLAPEDGTLRKVLKVGR